MPDLPAVVSVGHGDDVLGFPERQPGRPTGAVACAGRVADSPVASGGVREHWARAAAGSGPPRHLRRPSRLSLPRPRRDETIVYADTGDEQVDVSTRDDAAGQPPPGPGKPASAATVESIDEVDQWTLQGQFQNLSPLWKYSWPNGEQVYVSANVRRGRPVHDDRLAHRRLRWRDSPLAVLHATPEARTAVEHVVIWSSGIATFRRFSASSSGSGCTRRRSAIATPARRRAFLIVARSAGTPCSV